MSRYTVTTLTYHFETTITDFSQTTPPPSSTSTSRNGSLVQTSAPSGVTQANATPQSSSVTRPPSSTSSIVSVSTEPVTLSTSASGNSRVGSSLSSIDSTSSSSSWISGTTPTAMSSGSSSPGITSRSLPVAAIVLGVVAGVAILVCAFLLFIHLRRRRNPDIGAKPFPPTLPTRNPRQPYSATLDDNGTNTSIDRLVSDSYGGDDMQAPIVVGQLIPRKKAEEKKGQRVSIPPSGIVHQDSGAHLDIPPMYTP